MSARRYADHEDLPGWGADTQEKLRGASVLVLGTGGIGSAAAQYLAAAGFGRLGVVDLGVVSEPELTRAVLHYTPDVGVARTDSAAAKLRFLNPEIVVETYPARLGTENAHLLVAGHDVLVDTSDTPETRLAVNDACCADGTSLVSASARDLRGLLTTVVPGRSACLRCTFPDAPPRPATAGGALGALTGAVGALAALEAIKLVTGLGEPLLDRQLVLDGATANTRILATRRRPDCAACGPA